MVVVHSRVQVTTIGRWPKVRIRGVLVQRLGEHHLVQDGVWVRVAKGFRGFGVSTYIKVGMKGRWGQLDHRRTSRGFAERASG